MAASTFIGIRLNPEEMKMLGKCCPSNSRGDFNRSEYFRMLLRRDHEKRFGDGAEIPVRQVSSEWRNGRPRLEQELPFSKGLSATQAGLPMKVKKGGK